MTAADLAAQASAADVWPPCIGIDPGSQHTGVVLRVGREAIEGVTVEKRGDVGRHTAQVDYAGEVVRIVRLFVQRNAWALGEEADRRADPVRRYRVAVETLVEPTGRPVKGRQPAVAPSVLRYLPGASCVLGMVCGTWPDAIRVPPRGGGLGGWEGLDKAVYPEVLMRQAPPGWLRDGKERKHQRSAWMISGVGHLLTAKRPPPAAAESALAPAPAAPAAPADLPALLRAVTAAVAERRPDPGDAESLLLAVRAALPDVPGAAEALGQRLPDVCAAALPALRPGLPPDDLHEQARRLRREARELLGAGA